jgi:Uma2 family endonuclease
MTEAARKLPASMTAEEYLALEDSSPLKHEFVDGVVYAMVGATDRHNLIAGNLFASLYGQVPKGCQVFIMAMKLRTVFNNAMHFYYPDVMVACSAADRAPLYREQPSLLIEVASPSTERIDRGEKLNAYRQISSLVEYAIVSQDVTEIEMFRRRSDWKREVLAPGEPLVLESVGLTIPFAQVYREVTL